MASLRPAAVCVRQAALWKVGGIETRYLTTLFNPEFEFFPTEFGKKQGLGNTAASAMLPHESHVASSLHTVHFAQVPAQPLEVTLYGSRDPKNRGRSHRSSGKAPSTATCQRWKMAVPHPTTPATPHPTPQHQPQQHTWAVVCWPRASVALVRPKALRRVSAKWRCHGQRP
eukprot:50313-Chlamydomonas_euryale.AAC.2